MTKQQDPSQASEVEVLKAQVAELQKQLEEAVRFKDVAARAQADLQNAKARAEREAGELRKFASEMLVVRLLPTLDNFQRAFQQIPAEISPHEWTKGVAAIEQDLMKQMAEVGLKRMHSLDQMADPARHEVLTVGPGEEGKVTEVFEEGYELHGKILRPAKVKVGDGTAIV